MKYSSGSAVVGLIEIFLLYKIDIYLVPVLQVSKVHQVIVSNFLKGKDTTGSK